MAPLSIRPPESGVLFGPLMAVLAVGGIPVVTATFTATNVLGVRNGLEVERVAARTITAEMVDVETLRDRAYE